MDSTARIKPITKVLIVVSTSEHSNLVFRYLIDQTVLLVDPLGPASDKLMFERLRLSNSTKRIGLEFSDEAKNS